MPLLPKYAAALLSLLVATLAATGVSQGGRQRVLEKWLSAPERVEPVRIIGAEIDDQRGGRKSVRFREPFDADDDDWLKGLAVRVKNVSGKTITYIGVKIWLPAPTPDDSEHGVMTIISYGIYPEWAKARAAEQKTVAPNEVVEVQIPEREYNRLKQLLQSVSGQSAYDKASLLLGDVLFADGNVYRSGRVEKYEPFVPSKISSRKGAEPPVKPARKNLFKKISFGPGVESFFYL